MKTVPVHLLVWLLDDHLRNCIFMFTRHNANSLIWVCTVCICHFVRNFVSELSDIYPTDTKFSIGKFYLPIHTCHISHCEIKSHRIWPLWKAIPIKHSNLTEFSDHFTTDFYEEININHTLLWFSQVS